MSSKVTGQTVIAALAALGAFLAPATAGAATTVGSNPTGTTGCGPMDTFVQTATSLGSPSYTVPAGGGVITSWSFLAGSTPGEQDKLKILRRTANPDEFLVVGESALMTMTPSTLNTFSTRIPVHAGDLLGLFTADGGDCSKFTNNPADTDDFVNTDPAPGSTYTGTAENGAQYNVSTQLEPDADADGYGDETQDGCPTDPTTHAACQADLAVAKVANRPLATVGDTITYTIAVRNNSAFNAARSVSLVDALPPNTTLVSVTPSTGTCVGASCSLGDLAKGATATVTIVVRATAAGVATDTARAASATGDPNQANNTTTASTAVVPVFAMKLKPQTVTVKHGRVRLKLACPTAAIGNCVGKDTLKTAAKVTAAARKKKVLTLGSKTFSIKAGKTGTVTVKLSKPALRLVARSRTVKAKQFVVAHDSRGVSRKATGGVKIKAPKSRKH